MASENQSDDYITRTILSGSTYERVRCQRYAFFRQPLPRTLTLLSVVLGLLALSLPMYGLYPASVEPYLPATDPAVAAPSALLLGAFGGAMQLLAVVLLVGAGLYRARTAPLTEAQAYNVVDVEDFARYVGLAAGGLATLISIGMFAVGLGGEAAVETYLGTVGQTPFVDSGVGTSVETVALAAFAASLVTFVAGRYLAWRLSAADA